MAVNKVFQVVGVVVFLAVGIAAVWMMHQPAKIRRSIQLSDSVVAVIGDLYITTFELQQAFETAHPALKQGASERERLYSVLTAMLAEKILSQEACRLGFQKNKRIQQLQSEFQRNSLVEHVIAADVDSLITVSNDEANEETMKSLVSFKFRYWMEPTKERAERVRTKMQKDGYAAVVQQLVSQNPELKEIAPELESDYLRWTEIESRFYEAIKTLPIGDISVPVEYDGAFYLLQIVDIRRSGLTTTMVEDAIPTSKKVIFARKRMAARKAYVAALMEPKNVKTNAAALNILAQAVNEWYSSSSLNSIDFFSALDKAGDSYPKMAVFKEEQDRILVTTTDKQFSIMEIARALPLRKIMKEFKQPFAAFAAYTAASVRDHYLEQLGTARNYQNDLAYSENLRGWNDKWLYEEYRLKYTLEQPENKKNVNNVTVRQYFVKKDQEFLLQKIDSLANIMPPQLNTTVLDTIQLSEPTKTRDMEVLFFKGGTNNLAFPTIGHEWIDDIPRLKTIFKIESSNKHE